MFLRVEQFQKESSNPPPGVKEIPSVLIRISDHPRYSIHGKPIFCWILWKLQFKTLILSKLFNSVDVLLIFCPNRCQRLHVYNFGSAYLINYNFNLSSYIGLLFLCIIPLIEFIAPRIAATFIPDSHADIFTWATWFRDVQAFSGDTWNRWRRQVSKNCHVHQPTSDRSATFASRYTLTFNTYFIC